MRKQSELDAAAARRGIVTGTVTAILRQVGKTVAPTDPSTAVTALLADSPGIGSRTTERWVALPGVSAGHKPDHGRHFHP